MLKSPTKILNQSGTLYPDDIQLNHVSNPSDLMYYSAGPGNPFKDIISWPSSTQEAAKNVLDSSSSVMISPCPFPQIIRNLNPVCSTFGISTISTNEFQLDVFPNPASSNYITVSYQLNKNASVEFKIVDYTGREVIALNDEKKSAGTYNEQVNISELAEGIYLFIANINGEYQTIKFIKL